MQRRDLCELTNVCDPDRKRDESPLRWGLDFIFVYRTFFVPVSMISNKL